MASTAGCTTYAAPLSTSPKIRIVIDTIQQEIILQGAGTSSAESESGLYTRSGFCRRNARAEEGELRVVASIQRESIDARAIHHLPKFGSFGFKLWTLAGDSHSFRDHPACNLTSTPTRS